MERRHCRSALIAVAILGLGCGGGGTEPELIDYSGIWTGLTGANRDVRMVVGQGGTIDSLSIRVRLSVGLSACTGPLLLNESATIVGNTFSADTYFPGSNIVSTVAGTFSSASAMSGTYEGFSGSFSLICGSSFSVGTGSLLSSGTFSLTKSAGP